MQALRIQDASTLKNLFLKEDSLSTVREELLSLKNKSGKILKILNAAFEKLNTIVTAAERLDIKVRYSLIPSFYFIFYGRGSFSSLILICGVFYL